MKIKEIKIEMIVLTIILLVLMFFVVYSAKKDPAIHDKVVLLDEKSSPMPEMRTSMYYVDVQLKMKSIMLGENTFLKYKKELTNLERKDINLETIYSDLNRDTIAINENLTETLSDIQELNPKEEKTKRNQERLVASVNRLSDKLVALSNSINTNNESIKTILKRIDEVCYEYKQVSNNLNLQKNG